MSLAQALITKYNSLFDSSLDFLQDRWELLQMFLSGGKPNFRHSRHPNRNLPDTHQGERQKQDCHLKNKRTQGKRRLSAVKCYVHSRTYYFRYTESFGFQHLSVLEDLELELVALWMVAQKV